MNLPSNGTVACIRNPDSTQPESWLCFRDPLEIVFTHRLDEVEQVFQRVEKLQSSGYYVVGFVSYEAAPAFDSALRVAPKHRAIPLVWFAAFDHAEPADSLPASRTDAPLRWYNHESKHQYDRKIQQIRDWIADGETYQVNFTGRWRASVRSDGFSLFSQLYRVQPVPYAAYIRTQDFAISSLSPELFFSQSGEVITCKPMKGTARRGLTLADDQQVAIQLHHSEKDRAENVMIVDMVRNDLGKLAKPGTVQVQQLFQVERYRTLHQMTSTITARAPASVWQLFQALFPSASITGAPKVRTMQLIEQLEQEPRGVYCGAVGFLAPDFTSQFSVAIRTLFLNRNSGVAEYGSGGGIVWDSHPASEWRERKLKTAILTHHDVPFNLLETMRVRANGEIVLLEEHLRRLEESAAYFDFPYAKSSIRSEIVTCAQSAAHDRIMRVLLSESGELRFEWRELKPQLLRRKVQLAPHPVPFESPLRYHKTSLREAYQKLLRQFPHVNDLLLYNHRNEVTESTIANIVVDLDGELYTPPISGGLLNGTFRRHLLELCKIQERVILLDDLPKARRIYLVNSVRGWRVAQLV